MIFPLYLKKNQMVQSYYSFQCLFNYDIFNTVWNTSKNLYIWLCQTRGNISQCGNFMIFLSFRFYVKSILENLGVLKLQFFVILGALKMVKLVNLSLQNVQKFIKAKFRAFKCVKMANFAFLEPISCIIWVIENLWNSHTVEIAKNFHIQC